MCSSWQSPLFTNNLKKIKNLKITVFWWSYFETQRSCVNRFFHFFPSVLISFLMFSPSLVVMVTMIHSFSLCSPSGCTFWGKKPWSRKKKILWQLGTLVGAPVGIALIAGIAIPAMIIGIPVYVGRKVRANPRQLRNDVEQRWSNQQFFQRDENHRVNEVNREQLALVQL